jgi:hypothetical protein
VVDLNTCEEFAEGILCLAVDKAEGDDIFRRARLAAELGQDFPHQEREHAAKLIVDAWQIAEVLGNMLVVDQDTFRRFSGAIRAVVEGLLPAVTVDLPPETPVGPLAALSPNDRQSAPVEKLQRYHRGPEAMKAKISDDVSAPQFTDAELDHVEEDLVLALEDVHWKGKGRYLRPSAIRGHLMDRGHTRARIEATFARLVQRGVFEWRDHEPPGVLEVEFKKYYTTPERWFKYVANRKNKAVAATPIAQQAPDVSGLYHVADTTAILNFSLPDVQAPGQAQPVTSANVSTAQATKRKRSTEPGEARAKIIAGLTEHHQYADGSCMNTEPIGVNELARTVQVSPASVSTFFKDKFQGHDKYRGLCLDVTRLVGSLKLLRGEYSPHHLYGSTPPGEGSQDGE